MTQLTDDYINKKRNVEINVYYEKKYNSYLDVLKYFTLYVVGLLILAILRKRYFLSYSITNILSFILVIIGSMHIYVKIADINARNNINFDEYDWTFDPSEHSDPNKLDNSLQSQSDGTGLLCIESECCDPVDHKWCPATGKCVSTTIYSEVLCETDNTVDQSSTISGDSQFECPNYTSQSTCDSANMCLWCPSENKCLPMVGVNSPCATNPGADNTTVIQDDEAIDAGLIGTSGGTSGGSGDISQHISEKHNSHEHFVGKYVLDIKKNFSDFTNSIFNKNIHTKNKTTNVKSICQYDRNYATV